MSIEKRGYLLLHSSGVLCVLKGSCRSSKTNTEVLGYTLDFTYVQRNLPKIIQNLVKNRQTPKTVQDKYRHCPARCYSRQQSTFPLQQLPQMADNVSPHL